MNLSRAVKLVFVLIVIAIAVMLYPPLRLSALVLAGRSPVCPLSNAVHAEENQKRQIEIKDRDSEGQQDDRAKMTSTSTGRLRKATYWIAAGSRYVLPFNLAEQERKIYGTGRELRPSGRRGARLRGEHRRVRA